MTPRLAAALLLLSSPMWAGKRITMEVVELDANKVTTRELLLDSDRLRMADGNNVILFLTKGGNRIVAIDKSRNEYREIDQATIQQLAGAMAGAMAQMQAQMKSMTPEQRAVMEQVMGRGASSTTGKMTYTSKGNATVSGFRCTNYDGLRAGQKTIELCAATPADLKLSATDFQVLEKLRDFGSSLMASFQNSPISAMVAIDEIMPQGVNGLPVQETTYVVGKPAERRTVKSLADTTVTEADFSTGTARKIEFQLPGAGRAAKGKAK